MVGESVGAFVGTRVGGCDGGDDDGAGDTDGSGVGWRVGRPVGARVGGFETTSTPRDSESTTVEFTFWLTAVAKELLLSDDVTPDAHSSTEEVDDSVVVEITSNFKVHTTLLVNSTRLVATAYDSTHPRIWLTVTLSCVATVCFRAADCLSLGAVDALNSSDTSSLMVSLVVGSGLIVG